MFDLFFTPISIIKSTIHPDSPGLLVTGLPKRYVRGREEEQVILFLTLSGQNTPKADTTRALLEKAAATYFQTPGSATAALRSAVEIINTSLYERNSRGTSAAMKLYGQITVVSIRGFRIVAAQAGMSHALTLTDHGCEHYTSLNHEATQLGTREVPDLSFFQAEVEDSSRLLLADQDSAEWDLLCRPFAPVVSLDAIQNKVLSQLPSQFEGALIRLKLGSGNIQEVPFTSLAPQSTYQPLRQPISGPALVSGGTLPVNPLQEKVETGTHVENMKPGQPPSEPIYSNAEKPRRIQKKKRLIPRLTAFFQKLFVIWAGFIRWIKPKLHLKVPRPNIQINPAEIKEAATLSNGSMVLIAVGVPVFVCIIALLIYINRGQTQQSLYYTALAQAAVNEALTQSDPQTQYSTWSNAVTYLDKAENYKVTDLTRALRIQAENAVDGVDKTIRLEYRAAITNSLPPGTKIGKIVATATELYLLDTRKGQVYRATLTGRGYELDPNFSCGPSPFVGELIDIAPLSVNNIYKATILGIDADGTLLFCAPEKTPDAINLSKPSTGIGRISAFSFDSGNLYLLDKPNNSLWIYISQNGIFKDSPLSLTATAPVSLTSAVDLTANGPDLYILHDDGHLSVCTISYVTTAPTQCSDPAAYADSRPGREPNPMVITGTTFSQVEYVQPPDPSVFLFDEGTNGVYHFSLKLNLHRVIKPLLTGNNRLPKKTPTAFTISPNRTIFIAFGDQVYVAIAP
jgi:hypothetical protein